MKKKRKNKSIWTVKKKPISDPFFLKNLDLIDSIQINLNILDTVFLNLG